MSFKHIVSLLASLSLLGELACAAAPSAKPNILFILTDDRGYSDPGCFGGEIATQWWREESRHAAYAPESTQTSEHYKPQGDRGSGKTYVPSAMPEKLADRYPLRSMTGHPGATPPPTPAP